MKNDYLGKSILFLTDVPYVIAGRGADIFGRGTAYFFADKFNNINTEK